MSNEVLAIIIAIIIMVPAILFYELIIVRNYADKFLPPTVLSLFSNGNPRNLNKKNEKDKKAYFEMTHTTVVRVEESAVNKNELKKIFLSDVPTEIYPEIEKKFFEIVKSIGYPEIKLEKKINFKELFEKNQK